MLSFNMISQIVEQQRKMIELQGKTIELIIGRRVP